MTLDVRTLSAPLVYFIMSYFLHNKMYSIVCLKCSDFEILLVIFKICIPHGRTMVGHANAGIITYGKGSGKSMEFYFPNLVLTLLQ